MCDPLLLLQKIPATFWGVIVGSAFSLGGIVISNRANDRRLQEQLAHERKLKAKERELTLRKEIYLNATEAIAVGINTLAQFTNLEMKSDEITHSYTEKVPSIAKIYLIAGQATSSAVTKLTSELAGAFLRLSAKRAILVNEKTSADSLQRLMESSSIERDRMLEFMKQYNINNEKDDHKWKTISGNFDFEKNRIEKWRAELEVHTKELFYKHAAFVVECIEETQKLSRLLTPVLSAARQELELPFDEINYTAALEQGFIQNNADIDAFLHQIRGSIDA